MGDGAGFQPGLSAFNHLSPSLLHSHLCPTPHQIQVRLPRSFPCSSALPTTSLLDLHGFHCQPFNGSNRERDSVKLAAWRSGSSRFRRCFWGAFLIVTQGRATSLWNRLSQGQPTLQDGYNVRVIQAARRLKAPYEVGWIVCVIPMKCTRVSFHSGSLYSLEMCGFFSSTSHSH